MSDIVKSQRLLISGNVETIKVMCEFYEINMFPHVNTPIFGLSLKDKILFDIYTRLYYYVKTLSRLDSSSDFQTIIAIKRSMFEHFVDFKLIKSEVLKYPLEKYFYYSKIARYKEAIKICETKFDDSDSEYHYFVSEDYVELANKTLVNGKDCFFYLMDKLWDKRFETQDINRKLKDNIPKKWHGLGLPEAADKVGLKDMYSKIYSICNMFIHSGPIAFYRFDEHTAEILYYFSFNIALYIFRMTTIMVAEELKLNKALENFYIVMEEIRKKPENIATQKLLNELIGE